MEKAISIEKLLDSKIFDVNFDYDEWPGTSTCKEDAIRGFNGSYFSLR